MILQEHAVAVAADTYKRGSLYLSKLGVKPLPMGERMKEQIKGKTIAEKKKHMDKIKFNGLASIKTYLPQLSGCSIQLLPARRVYTVYYPAVVPGSMSKTWGHFSQKQCLKHVLLWAWNRHAEETRQPCPWNFDLLLM